MSNKRDRESSPLLREVDDELELGNDNNITNVVSNNNSLRNSNANSSNTSIDNSNDNNNNVNVGDLGVRSGTQSPTNNNNNNNNSNNNSSNNNNGETAQDSFYGSSMVSISLSEALEAVHDPTHESADPYEVVRKRHRNDDKSPWQFWKFTRREYKEMVIQRSPYYLFPLSIQLKNYNLRDFLADTIAGVGVACMLVPQALAYAILAGLPPIYGLYTAWFPLIVFACLTTSRHVAFGPDALGSLLVGITIHHLIPNNDIKNNNNINNNNNGVNINNGVNNVIGMIGSVGAAADNTEEAIMYAGVLCFMVGIFLFLLGLVRFGFIDNVLSRPLLCGFVNAVAIIILINQLVTFLGLPKTSAETSIDILTHVINHISEIEWTTFLIGILSLLILVGLRILRTKFPHSTFIKFLIGNLIVVIVGIVMSYFMKLEKKRVHILGTIPDSFPTPVLPSLNVQRVTDTFFECVVIAVIGFIETMAAAKLYANKHGYQISPNRELVAIGFANTLGAFFRSYPTFGSLTRTAMADYYGAKTQIYTLITTILILLTIFFLGPVFYYLPRVVMSAIIVVAAVSLFEFHDIVFLWKIRAWTDLALLFLTLIATVILGPDLGIFIGVGLSLLIIVKQSAFPHIAILGESGQNHWVDISTDTQAKPRPGILVIRVEEGLYFSNIEIIKDMFQRIQVYGSYKAHPTDKKNDAPIHSIIIHASNITDMDASAIQVLSEMIHEYKKSHIFVCFVKLRPHLKTMFIKSDIIGALGGNHVFSSLSDALKYIDTNISNTQSSGSNIEIGNTA